MDFTYGIQRPNQNRWGIKCSLNNYLWMPPPPRVLDVPLTWKLENRNIGRAIQYRMNEHSAAASMTLAPSAVVLGASS